MSAAGPRSLNPHASEVRTFHELHSSGSTTGREPAIEGLLGQVTPQASWKFPYAKGEQVWDSVADGFMSYWLKPHGYDATLGVPLEAYLFQGCIAEFSECHPKRRFSAQPVTSDGENLPGRFRGPSLLGRNPLSEGSSESPLAQERWGALLESLKNPRDRAFVELWATEEISVRAFAKVLLIMHLALEEQRIPRKTDERPAAHKPAPRQNVALPRLAQSFLERLDAFGVSGAVARSARTTRLELGQATKHIIGFMLSLA